jgi:hypothetical protein
VDFEAADRIDRERVIGHALAEAAIVLLGQHVVGTRMATCLPNSTALNAARIASSVLP